MAAVRPDQILALAILIIGVGIILVGGSPVPIEELVEERRVVPDEREATSDTEQTILYAVERVVDGDTIIIQGFKDSIRLIGIDTPEMGNQFGPRECYALEATSRLDELIGGKEVILEADIEDRDRYHRLLRYVYLPDGIFVNLAMVKEGFAQMLTIPPNIRYVPAFLAAQQDARTAQRGLWNRAACSN